MLAFYDISNICNRCKKWKIFIEDIFQNIDKIVNGKIKIVKERKFHKLP